MRRKPEFWIDGIAPAIASPLVPFLVSKLPEVVTVQDASLDALCMLRIINALNRHWATLYFSVPQSHIIPQTEFIHSKVGSLTYLKIHISRCYNLDENLAQRF